MIKATFQINHNYYYFEIKDSLMDQDNHLQDQNSDDNQNEIKGYFCNKCELEIPFNKLSSNPVFQVPCCRFQICYKCAKQVMSYGITKYCPNSRCYQKIDIEKMNRYFQKQMSNSIEIQKNNQFNEKIIETPVCCYNCPQREILKSTTTPQYYSCQKCQYITCIKHKSSLQICFCICPLCLEDIQIEDDKKICIKCGFYQCQKCGNSGTIKLDLCPCQKKMEEEKVEEPLQQKSQIKNQKDQEKLQNLELIEKNVQNAQQILKEEEEEEKDKNYKIKNQKQKKHDPIFFGDQFCSICLVELNPTELMSINNCKHQICRYCMFQGNEICLYC